MLLSFPLRSNTKHTWWNRRQSPREWTSESWVEIWSSSFLSNRRSGKGKRRLRRNEGSSMIWCYNCNISRLVSVVMYVKVCILKMVMLTPVHLRCVCSILYCLSYLRPSRRKGLCFVGLLADLLSTSLVRSSQEKFPNISKIPCFYIGQNLTILSGPKSNYFAWTRYV